MKYADFIIEAALEAVILITIASSISVCISPEHIYYVFVVLFWCTGLMSFIYTSTTPLALPLILAAVVVLLLGHYDVYLWLHNLWLT